ncbi:MAG: hypothetical protein IIT47_04050, partial [Oscillospiraceae bacterium]|nr:hypothetical protein [Oscillospiraceae bacterium]
VIPDFIGWALLFRAYDMLGSYMEGKKYLKWAFLILLILSAVTWTYDLFMPEQAAPQLLYTVITLISVVAMFLFFGVLEKIAADYQSPRQSTLRMLKYINVVLHAAVVILAMLYARTVSEGAASAADVVGTPYQVTLVTMMGVAGVAALVSAIVTAVVLFKLKGEVSDKLA